MLRLVSLIAVVAVVSALPAPATSTWKSSPNHISSLSFNEKLMLCGTILTPPPEYMLDTTVANDLPASFDSRAQWPTCIHPIRDQAQCGSCWAFGAAESFSDRLCIASNTTTNIVLSPEALVSCDKYLCMGCNGGIPYLAWEYLAIKGIVSDSCFPYSAGTGHAPACVKTCADGSAWTTHKVKLGSVKHYGNEQAIMSAIYTSGPVEGAFSVFEDFMDYSSGVYQHTTGKMLGGHAIKILGWGEDNGVKYWLCANSWGVGWGEQGFFRILRGKNECGIESGVTAGQPDVSSAALSTSVDADTRVCTTCKKFADAVVNKLINLVFQGTVVGGCSDLCGHLGNQAEQEVCDGLCVLAGEIGFETALAHAKLNPENLCYDLRVCKH